MLDRILYQRLEQHAGYHDIERSRIEFFDDAQFVASESHNFDIEIVIDEFEFVPQRHKRLAGIEKPAENGGQLENHVARHIGIEPDQGRNRIQGVEQEMWIYLILQRLHACVQQ